MKKSKISITEATKQYRIATLTIKEISEKQKGYKDLILKYAKDNPDKYLGKSIHLENGVSVSRRENKDKCTLNQDLCTPEWLDRAIDLGLGDLIEIGISVNAEKLNEHQLKLLDEVDFKTEMREDTYSVNIS